MGCTLCLLFATLQHREVWNHPTLCFWYHTIHHLSQYDMLTIPTHPRNPSIYLWIRLPNTNSTVLTPRGITLSIRMISQTSNRSMMSLMRFQLPPTVKIKHIHLQITPQFSRGLLGSQCHTSTASSTPGNELFTRGMKWCTTLFFEMYWHFVGMHLLVRCHVEKCDILSGGNGQDGFASGQCEQFHVTDSSLFGIHGKGAD